LVTPGGLCLIDTPGMRELALWDARDGVASTFSDIESLARACRFRDCTHHDEPGCAVLEAEADGVLPPGRLASYRRLQRELDHTERRANESASNATKKRWKSISRASRERRRLNRKLGLKDW
jgi:ribosome biogenesis GTPase